MAAEVEAVVLPAQLDPQFCAVMTAALDAASRVGPQALKSALPAETCVVLLDRCQRLLQTEPTMLEVGWPAPHAAPQHWILKAPPPPAAAAAASCSLVVRAGPASSC